MRITARADYALRAVVELALNVDSGPVTGETIARAQGIPSKFSENILADLRRAGIVSSQRGAVGGYWLARSASALTVGDVIRALEGPILNISDSRPEQVEYPENSMALRDVWVAARASLRDVLDQTTIADVARKTLPDHVRRAVADPRAWDWAGPHGD